MCQVWQATQQRDDTGGKRACRTMRKTCLHAISCMQEAHVEFDARKDCVRGLRVCSLTSRWARAGWSGWAVHAQLLELQRAQTKHSHFVIHDGLELLVDLPQAEEVHSSKRRSQGKDKLCPVERPNDTTLTLLHLCIACFAHTELPSCDFHLISTQYFLKWICASMLWTLVFMAACLLTTPLTGD